MELEVFARIVQRWWLALAVALIIGSGLGYLYAQSREPVYQTGVDLLVGPLSADSNVLRASGQTAQTYAELAAAAATLDLVEQRLGNPPFTSVSVTATASDVTRILKVRVRAVDPNLASDVANGVADELIRVADDEVAAAELAVAADQPNVARVGEIRVLESSTPPTESVAPNVQLITALGGVSLLITAIVLLVVYEYARQAVRVIGDLQRVLPDSLFGRVERSWDLDHPTFIPVLHQSGPTANSFRGLAVDIAAQLPSEDAGAALVVGGVATGDRSADVALNIAAAWAVTGRRVALIDAHESGHPVRTSLRSVLERPDEPSRINLGTGADIVLDGRYEGVETGVLDVYSTAFARLAQRHRFSAAMAELGAAYDYVVVFTEPAFGSATAVRWAGASSGALLAVGSDVASARTVQQCAATLSRAATVFLGVVFDERRRRRRWLSFWRRLFGAGGRRTPARRPVKKPARRHEPAEAEMSGTS